MIIVFRPSGDHPQGDKTVAFSHSATPPPLCEDDFIPTPVSFLVAFFLDWFYKKFLFFWPAIYLYKPRSKLISKDDMILLILPCLYYAHLSSLLDSQLSPYKSYYFLNSSTNKSNA